MAGKGGRAGEAEGWRGAMRAYLTKDLGEAETPRDPGLAQLCAGVEGRAWLGIRDSGSRGDTVEKRGVPGLVPAAS